jgi:hypothetical protein
MSRWTSRAVAFTSALATLAIAALAANDASAAPKRPKSDPVASAPPGAEFDKQAAATAIAEVSLLKCRATNASRGEGHVTITFTPAGSATQATIDKGPWVGSPVAKCMVREFKKTKVPPFRGDAVTVGKSFHFE